MDHAEHSVTISWTINASADAIYAAWTEPEIMRTWLAEIVEADVRIGGQYKIENHEEDGTVNIHRGEFRELELGRRVLMTFRHDSTEPGTYVGEFVEVTLRPLGPNQTELTLTNGWNVTPLSDEDADAIRAGWNNWIDMMEEALGLQTT